MVFDLLAANTGIFDGWSFIHFGTGVAVGVLFITSPKRLGRSLILFFLIFLGWELFEIIQPSGGFGGQENGLNLISDMVFGLAGLAFGAWANRVESVKS